MSEGAFNREMMTLARESRGMTQSELASAMVITQSKLSRIEGGLLPTSDDELQRAADLLGYPLSFFHSPGPRRVEGCGCFNYRKRSTMPMRLLRKILADIDIMRMRIAELLRGIDVGVIDGFVKRDIDEYNSNVEQIARDVRAHWQIPPGPIQNLTETIEACGGLVIPMRFGTSKLDAVSQTCPGLPALFFVNADAPVDRCRHTLAHEIGHLVMHRMVTSTMEDEADRFAAEFLMPADQIAGEFWPPITLESLAGMKPRWRTSMHSLAYRCRTLDLIDHNQATRLFIQMSKLGYKRREPIELPAEPPGIISDAITMRRERQGMEDDDFAQITYCTSGDDFRIAFSGGRERLRLVR
jgi:Zn-dependent peptidase ImmA (M78 family)